MGNNSSNKGYRNKSFRTQAKEAGEERKHKWTDERIDELCDRLNKFYENEENVFLIDFWSQQRDLLFYNELPNYLSMKSPRFLSTYVRCSQLQTARLLKKGMNKKYNSNFIEFILMNSGEGYMPRSAVAIQQTNVHVNQLPPINLGVRKLNQGGKMQLPEDVQDVEYIAGDDADKKARDKARWERRKASMPAYDKSLPMHIRMTAKNYDEAEEMKQQQSNQNDDPQQNSEQNLE